MKLPIYSLQKNFFIALAFFLSMTNQNLHAQINLSGGNENGRFRASFLGSSTAGLIKKSSLDKYIGSFTGQYKFLDQRLSHCHTARRASMT